LFFSKLNGRKLGFNTPLTGYYSSLAFDSVTSFFWKWSALELICLCIFLETDQTNLHQSFFNGLGEITC